MAVGATIALHPHRAHVGQQHHRALPDLVVETREGQLGAHDRVGVTQQFQTLEGDLTDDPDAEARSGERLAADNNLGKSQLATDRANLILEQGAQRFDERELEVLGKTSHVVVTLDVGRAGSATRLHDIRIQGSLNQKLDLRAVAGGFQNERLGGCLEAPDELAADDFALLLGVGDSGERVHELIDGVDGYQTHPGGGDVVFLDLAALVLAQQTVVDENADELVADGLMHDRSGNSGVDPAGKAANDPAGADLLPDARDLLGDHVAAVPVRGDARGGVQEVFEHALAEFGVLDLRMPLHAVEATLVARERGHRGGGARGEHGEAGRGLRNGVTVAHPGGLLARLRAEEGAFPCGQGDDCCAVFAQAGVGHLAAELLRHHLEAVANAENRNTELEDAGIQRGRTGVVHARRPAAEHNSDRVFGGNLGRGDRVRHDLGVDARLAHAAGDQLGVLGAEVDHQHRALRGFSLCGGAQRMTPVLVSGAAERSSSVSSRCALRVMKCSTMKERNGTTPPRAIAMKRVNGQRMMLQRRKSAKR